MAKKLEPTHGLLFASFLFNKNNWTREELLKKWEERFGESSEFIPTINPLTKYYAKEMGKEAELSRFLVSTKTAFSRETLLKAKLWAHEWEYQMSEKRSVNIDPGMIYLEQVILSTTKPFAHRIYLGESIFGELTYLREGQRWVSLPWTYPDYQDSEKVLWFEALRSHLVKILENSPNKSIINS